MAAVLVGQSPPASSRHRLSKALPPPVPEHKGLTPIRVTMVGAERVGKTSLVSAFVNNFCPMIYAQTWDPMLFYKTMEVPSDPSNPQGQLLPLLVEIEDTYAWRSSEAEITAAGNDRYGRKRDARFFAKATGATVKALKKSADARREASETGGLFSSFEIDNTDKYVPITHRRMGYMVVFDPTEALSLETAKEIVETIKVAGDTPAPIVYMVACKLDKVFHDDDRRIVKEAEKFVFEKGSWVKFSQVSAMDLHQVRRVFRNVVLDVHAQGALWKEEFASREGASWASRAFGLFTPLASPAGVGRGGQDLFGETVITPRKGVPETPARSSLPSPHGAAVDPPASAPGNADCSVQ